MDPMVWTPYTELSPTAYGMLALTAFCAGWVDAIAGGGGLLTLPALFLAGLPPKMALGTNKVQAICGTLAAAHRFWRAGKVDVAVLQRLVPLALAGSALGTTAVLALSPDLIKPLFVPVFVAIGVYMAVKGDTGAEAAPERRTRKRDMATCALVLLIGAYDGFFGPGTGVFLFMVLVLVSGFDAVTATGTTKVVNAATNGAALAVFLTNGSLYPALGLCMACANALGGHAGSHMAITKGQRLIRWVVTVVVLVLATRLAWDVLRG